MSADEAGKLARLKALDLSKWSTSFWLVQRKGTQAPFGYAVLRVDIDPKLAKRLKGYLRAQVQERDAPTEAYDFNTSEPGEKLLTLESRATDFDKVQEAIDGGFDNPRATEYGQLLGAWAYVVLFESAEQRVFAWRKINTLNNPKRVISRQALFFENQRLVDLEDKQVFMIDPRFDFFVFDGTAFILSKSAFEASMSFREGMKQKSEELLDAFARLDFLTTVEPIRHYVGDNVHHLRKLAAIRHAGYYRQPEYLERLMHVVEVERWDLKIDAGRIVVEHGSIELLLKLLNNDRLRSPINGEVFDSSAKQAVAKAAPRR